MEFSQTSVVEIFCWNSQRLKAVRYFPRRASLWMPDRILDANLLTEGLRIINLNQIKLAKLISTFCHCRNLSSIFLLSTIYIYIYIWYHLWWLFFRFWVYLCCIHLMCKVNILSEKIPIYSFHAWKALNIVRKTPSQMLQGFYICFWLKPKERRKMMKMECILFFIKLLISILRLYWKLRLLTFFFADFDH